MFLFIYPTQDSTASNQKDKIQNAFYDKRTTLRTEGYIQKNASVINHNILFQIIQNLTNTKAPNLKSNVFDKMLSDEMLSIKRHFYDKDVRSTTSVTTPTKNNPPTPTLELKQKWPLIGFTEKPVNIIRNENSLKTNNKIRKILPAFKIGDKSDNIEEELQNVEKTIDKNDKVLGLRSLPEVRQPSHRNIYQQTEYKMCTCMKTNPSTCSHRCTGGSTACSHSTPTSNCLHCTQTIPQYTVSPVYYQPYFVGMTTHVPYINAYYHPDVINELKVPRKPKHRKTTTPHIDKELYYDTDDPNSDQHKDNYDENLDYYEDVSKHNKNEEKEHTIKLHAVERDEKGKRKHKHKNCHVKGDTRKKLVQDIFDDLKTYYSDSVIKDCYCTSSSSLVDINNFVLFVAYLLCVL
ncbi:uncharacterized protein LOC114364002 [Ostrinia furnacalis]|uniref:uncharacterized protein LOC114364002 n=1 Tax=Ostrinia furnacalis TaxID=93504 RepID=UPI001038904B|nr:uncharacterized protein LOC114364002 [Ostrinia furnacalis]